MGYETESQPLGTFCEDLASERVTPAGGTAGGAVAAVGTALCEMVCLHLARADATDADLAERRAELKDRRTGLFVLANEDAAVVDELFGADADPDSATRKRAVGVPLAVAEACRDVLKIATKITAADRPVIADAGTGAFLVHAAFRNAVFTVRRNLQSVDDRAFIEKTKRRVADVEAAADRAFEATLANVRGDE